MPYQMMMIQQQKIQKKSEQASTPATGSNAKKHNFQGKVAINS